MPVDIKTKKILLRWKALSHPEGLRRTKILANLLSLLASGFTAFVLFAVAMNLSVAWVVVGAFGIGWLGGEAQALRTRLAQWDTFSRYLDWSRIERDIQDAT